MNPELYWAAGFVDGEGCFSVSRSNPKRLKLRFSVTQNRREPLERLCQALSSVASLKVRGPRQRKDALSTNPYFSVEVTGQAAREIAYYLRPALSAPKQEQLQRCFDKIREG